MKQFTILYYSELEDKTVTWDTDRINEMRTAVFLNTINGKAETMVFENPGARLIYYKPAVGKVTVDKLRLSRYS